MAYSTQSFLTNGGGSYPLSIDYLEATHLVVTLGNTPLVLGVGYTVTSRVLTLTPDTGGGLVLKVVRVTPKDEMVHVFSAGAPYRDDTVDENNRLLLLIAQEAEEQAVSGLPVGNLTMGGYRILDVGQALASTEAATLGQVQGTVAAQLPTYDARYVRTGLTETLLSGARIRNDGVVTTISPVGSTRFLRFANGDDDACLTVGPQGAVTDIVWEFAERITSTRNLAALVGPTELTTKAYVDQAYNVQGELEYVNLAASTALPTVPTVCLLPTLVESRPDVSYNPATGEITAAKPGTYTRQLHLNVQASTNRTIYYCEQIWNGVTWLYKPYTGQRRDVTGTVNGQVSFITTGSYVANQVRRVLVWASGACTINTETPPGLTAGQADIVAAKLRMSLTSQNI